MTCDDWIKLAPDAATAAATLFVAFMAGKGLGTWKAQLKGQHAYEVARKVYLAALRVREGVSVVRAPFVSSGEQLAAAEKAKIEIKEHADFSSPHLDYAVYRDRWESIVGPFQELEASVLEAEVVLTPDVIEAFSRLRKHTSKLRFALDHVLRLRQERQPRGAADDFDNQQLAIFTRPVGADGDAYDAELQSIIKEFGRVLKPHLS